MVIQSSVLLFWAYMKSGFAYIFSSSLWLWLWLSLSLSFSLFLCYLLSIAFFALLPVVGECLLIFCMSFPFAHFVCTLFFFGFVLNDVFFSFCWCVSVCVCVCVFILFSSWNFCSVFLHSLNSFPHLSHVQPLARQILWQRWNIFVRVLWGYWRIFGCYICIHCTMSIVRSRYRFKRTDIVNIE